MADETTQIDNGQTGDTADAGQAAEGTVDITKQSDSDFMSDTVDFIKDTQKTILGDEDNIDSGDSGNAQDDTKVIPELAGKDIPDVFSDAAEASGMTPAEIIDFANGRTNEELLEMIPYLQPSPGKDDIKVDDKVVMQDDKAKKDNDSKTIDAELETKIAEKIAKQLEEKFGASLEEIEKFKAHQKEQAEKQTSATVSKIFDEASKEFPVFGKTDELPKFPSGRLAGQWIPTSPAMGARLEVLRYADAFMSKGADIDNAMVNALGTYKGLHLEKELERKQVRDLKNHETKLSGARIGRETKNKYADTRDEIIDDIRQRQRAAGIDKV
jgi:hypothetical protein